MLPLARISADDVRGGHHMNTNNQPPAEDVEFLKSKGMTEIEPGRWVSEWQGSDPDIEEFFDNLGPEGKEQLDLLARAGRVQNEFDQEQSGAGVAANLQLIGEGSLADAA